MRIRAQSGSGARESACERLPHTQRFLRRDYNGRGTSDGQRHCRAACGAGARRDAFLSGKRAACRRRSLSLRNAEPPSFRKARCSGSSIKTTARNYCSADGRGDIEAPDILRIVNRSGKGTAHPGQREPRRTENEKNKKTRSAAACACARAVAADDSRGGAFLLPQRLGQTVKLARRRCG